MVGRKILLVAAAATLALAALPATAQERNAIYTGGAQGAYHSLFCPPLPEVLKKAYFGTYQCTQSAGTVENIDRVLKNPKQIGFAQFDVFARQASQNPTVADKLVVIKQVATEGLWLVTKNQRLQNFGDVLGLARRIPFVLPPEASGATATFRYLQSIDQNGLGRATNIRHAASVAEVINQVAAGGGGEVGFFVQFADPENANIRAIQEKGLRVIPVWSDEISNAKVGERNVYQLNTYSLTAGGWVSSGKEETTASTGVVIFTGKPESFGTANDKDDQRDLIKRVSDLQDSEFLPKEGRIAKLMQSFKRVSATVANDLAASVRKAKEAIEQQSR